MFTKIKFFNKLKKVLSRPVESTEGRPWEEVRDELDKMFLEHEKRMKTRWGRLTYFIETLPRQIKDLKWWIIHRTIDKYHVIKINDLKPGYYDKDTQMLYGMMGLLVDFVEHELAFKNLILTKEEIAKVPWWMSVRAYRKKHARELGLAYLDWEISLGTCSADDEEYSPRQAEEAKEKKELYLWWKDVRPNRPDPYDFRGEKSSDGEFSKVLEVENQQDEEDNAMLIRLIKVRRSLWS